MHVIFIKMKEQSTYQQKDYLHGDTVAVDVVGEVVVTSMDTIEESNVGVVTAVVMLVGNTEGSTGNSSGRTKISPTR